MMEPWMVMSRIMNYIASQEGWLSVTPGQPTIKDKDSEKAQEHMHAAFSCKISLYSWRNTGRQLLKASR